MPNAATFEKWFDRLARNKMPGPALATAGMATGLLIMSAGLLPWKPFIGDILTGLGLVQVALSSALFVVFGVLQVRAGIRSPRKRRQANAPSSSRSRSPSHRKAPSA